MGFGHDHSHGHSHGHNESYEYITAIDDDDDIELSMKRSLLNVNDAPLKNHKFLDTNHQDNEFRTWGVIILCLISMIIEITCGILYGSLALIGDGIHMSTHAIAFFITAASYSYARRHENDTRFVFGTAKVGELAAFTSAIILIAISLFILYEGVTRFITPADLQYEQALPVSFVGLFVNIASGVILTMECKKIKHSQNNHLSQDEAKQLQKKIKKNLKHVKFKSILKPKSGGTCEIGHGHEHGHNEHDDDETFNLITSSGILIVSIYEDGIPPVFMLRFDNWKGEIPDAKNFAITTIRPDKSKQVFKFNRQSDLYYQSTKEIPEPHEFSAILRINNDKKEKFRMQFVETHGHNHIIDIRNNVSNDKKLKSSLVKRPGNTGIKKSNKKKNKKEKYEADNNFRAAIIHVVADAVVSVLVIIALVLAGNIKQCYFLDPLVGVIGSLVILSWGVQLLNDTTSSLLDMVPDNKLNQALRAVLEKDGSIINDFHVWRLGPGKLGSVISIIPPKDLPAKAANSNRYEYYSIQYYNNRIKGFKAVNHSTFEIIY